MKTSKLPKGPSPEYIAAWDACRALGAQLSAALTEVQKHGDHVYAYVLPAGQSHTLGFGTIEHIRLEAVIDPPVDRVERLCNELAVALDDWNAQSKMTFKAHVPPASSGCGFFFEDIRREKDLPRGSEAVTRLSDILDEAGRIIRNNPDLLVDQISINEHGVHTFIKVPGAPSIGEVGGDD